MRNPQEREQSPQQDGAGRNLRAPEPSNALEHQHSSVNGASKGRKGRIAFSGKLTSASSSSPDAGAAGSSKDQSGPPTTLLKPDTRDISSNTSNASGDASDANGTQDEQAEQIVDEWDRQQQRLGSVEAQRGGADQPASQPLPSSDDEAFLQLTDEEEGANPAKASPSATHAEADGLSLLQHVFPKRSDSFLAEILFQDCDGDVALAVDTLMAIDLAEQEEEDRTRFSNADGSDAGSSSWASSSTSSLSGQSRFGNEGGGLKDDSLELGGEGAALKGKKRKAARRRIQEEQLRIKAGLPVEPSSPFSSGNDVTGGSHVPKRQRDQMVKVNLTDVRHGASIRDPLGQKILQEATAQHVVPDQTDAIRFGETDEEYAKRLAQEERERTRDPDDDRPVKDNDWLLASSVLSQLSNLLDISSTKVSAVYNAAEFNLQLAFNGLVQSQANSNAPEGLASLDQAGQAPEGTAATIVQGIAALSDMPLKQVERLFCAAKGRQDAALDLIGLQKVLSEASDAHEWKRRQDEGNDAWLDALDPLAKLKLDGPANPSQQNKQKDSSSTAQAGVQYPSLLDASFSNGRKAKSASQQAHAPWHGTSGYAGIASSFPSAAQQLATTTATRLDSDSSVLPLSAARVGSDWQTVEHKKTHGDASRYRTGDCRAVADEYRQRRTAAIRQAAAAWRSTGGGAGAQGLAKSAQGGVAWYYADEARRLDAKARAWDLRAAQALVDERRVAKIGLLRSSTGHDGPGKGDEIDLHGLTVHEALSVTRRCVNQWYAQPAIASTGGSLKPLSIITGVGRHSMNQVALIKPAVVKMLEREGWRYDVDHHRGVITVRGVK